MSNFKNWLKTNHPETFEEGWKDWARAGVTAASMGLASQGDAEGIKTAPGAPTNIVQHLNKENSQDFQFTIELNSNTKNNPKLKAETLMKQLQNHYKLNSDTARKALKGNVSQYSVSDQYYLTDGINHDLIWIPGTSPKIANLIKIMQKYEKINAEGEPTFNLFLRVVAVKHLVANQKNTIINPRTGRPMIVNTPSYSSVPVHPSQLFDPKKIK